jgi:hypothetical protein
MISEFIDRKEEISLLEEEWTKEKWRLIVLYDRRRIGKTRLLLEFIKTKDRNGIFYIAEQSSVQIQINGLKDKMHHRFMDVRHAIFFWKDCHLSMQKSLSECRLRKRSSAI